jgi:hypothetical protein
MILLNVSFGIFAFLPQGWLFMLFVILIECVILTKLLKNKWFNKRIYGIATLTNMISGIIGIIISMALNGGWWLVVWFPWVSSYEVRTTTHFKALIIYYACAFILTIIIELLTNWLFLKKHYKDRKILTATMLANFVSYTVGTLILYLYSFS